MLLLSIFCTSPATATPVTRDIIATTFDAISGLPANVDLRDFGEADEGHQNIAVDDSGTIVFRASGVVTAPLSSYEAILSVAPGGNAVQPIVQSGDAAAGGGSFNRFEDLDLNGRGDLAFTASITGGAAETGLFRSFASEPGPFPRLATDLPANGLVRITDPGDVVLTGTIDEVAGFDGLHVAPADGGPLRTVAQYATPVPGVPGAFIRFPERVTANENGDLAFFSEVEFEDGTRLNAGVFHTRDGTTSFAGPFGGPAPDLPDGTVWEPQAAAVAPDGDLFVLGGFQEPESAFQFGAWYGDGPENLKLIGRADREVSFGSAFQADGSVFYAGEVGTTEALFKYDSGNLDIEVVIDEDTQTEFGFLRSFVPMATTDDDSLIFFANSDAIQEGFYAIDSAGDLTALVREGDIIDGNEILSLTPPTEGQSDANGDTLAVVAQIKREDAFGNAVLRFGFTTNFVYTGACGDNDWHNTVCAETNWIGSAGEPVTAPPGDALDGNESATITNASVSIVERPVTLNGLTATGALQVGNDLRLNGASEIENLNVTAAGSLTLDDALTTSGTASINNLSFEDDSRLISLGETVLTGNADLGGDFETRGKGVIVNKGTLAGSQTGTITGRLRNEQTVDQDKTLFLAGSIENDGTWQLNSAQLLVLEGSAGFQNASLLRSSSGFSQLEVSYAGSDGSSIEVRSGELALIDDGLFAGSTRIDFADHASLLLGGEVGKKTYTVTGAPVEGQNESASGGTLTVRRLDTGDGSIVIGRNAAFDIAAGSRLQLAGALLRLEGGDLTGSLEIATLKLDDGSRIRGQFDFKAGRLGISGEQPRRASLDIARDQRMAITAIPFEAGLEPPPDNRSLFGDVRVDGVVEQDAALTLQNSTITINTAGKWTITDGGWLADSGSSLTVKASSFEEDLPQGVFQLSSTARFEPTVIEFDGTVDNAGQIRVDRGRLSLTGSVMQLTRNNLTGADSLTGGVWFVGGKESNLRIGTGTIDTIGPNATVLRFSDGQVDNLDLNANLGTFFLSATDFATTGMLNGGRFFIVSGSGVDVSGRFDSTDGSLNVGSASRLTAGELTTSARSSSSIDGQLVITGQQTTVFKGKWSGKGIVSANGIRTVAAEINSGQSPGILTFDTPLFLADADTVFNIEIGGTEAGTSFDQLLFNGHVVLAGTLNFQFIDGFMPDVDDLFPFFEAVDTISGQFDRILLSGLGDDASFEVVVDPQTGALVLANVVAGTVAVAEPPALAVLLAGLLGLVWRRRTRTLRTHPSP